jgi:AcrR family transcriptional regulator
MRAAAKTLPSGLRRYQSALAESKRAALVEAAGRVFLERGFDGATVGAIAREASASLATLYKHFATKAELFGAVLEHLAAALDAAVAPAIGRKGDAIAALRAFAASYAELLRRPDTIPIFRIVIAESSRFPELTELFHSRAKEPLGCRFAEFLAERARSGEIAIDDPKRALGRFFGVLDNTLLWPALINPGWRPDAADIERAGEDAIAALLARPAAKARKRMKASR